MRRFEVICALVLSVGCGFSACAENGVCADGADGVKHAFRGRWITDAEMAAQVPRPVAAHLSERHFKKGRRR